MNAGIPAEWRIKMRSNTCFLYRSAGRDKVLREVSKTAQYCELDHESGLQLRLLAEELLGMLENITGPYKGLFWIEAENDINFRLHIQIEKPDKSKTREKLLSISSKGQNTAAGGVVGRLRNMFENCMDNYEELENYGIQNGIVCTSLGDMYAGCVARDGSIAWSLKDFEASMSKDSGEWDELEKYIVISLADDIAVNMKKGRADIIVYKSFE